MYSAADTPEAVRFQWNLLLFFNVLLDWLHVFIREFVPLLGILTH